MSENNISEEEKMHFKFKSSFIDIVVNPEIILVIRLPVRHGYGLHERKMCPTREQGTTLDKVAIFTLAVK